MNNPAGMVRDNIEELRKAVQESAKATSKTAGDVQDDFEALRDDIAQLAEKLGAIASTRGGRAWKRTRSGIGEAISDAESMTRKAGDDLTEAIEGSIHARPYTTLAVAAGIGFLVGASWRR
jgi:ElaB/YqjD/DUF883 family membrane-anchored ribosome-binding protein